MAANGPKQIIQKNCVLGLEVHKESPVGWLLCGNRRAGIAIVERTQKSFEVDLSAKLEVHKRITKTKLLTAEFKLRRPRTENNTLTKAPIALSCRMFQCELQLCYFMPRVHQSKDRALRKKIDTDRGFWTQAATYKLADCLRPRRLLRYLVGREYTNCIYAVLLAMLKAKASKG